MMNHRPFFDDVTAISQMYDAVFFIVMVSLAGVILLPISNNPSSVDSLVDKHREDFVDDALHTFLVSRTDLFYYRFCGSLLDSLAQNIGINITEHGLYDSITNWLLAHEQRHKTYATLLSENLGCQFIVPFNVNGLNRINIFTEEYDRELQNNTKDFFSKYIGDKYRFNLSAWWHPIKAIHFGGGFSIGEHPPTKNCYVAQRFIMMPYTPVFYFQNKTIILTKHWVRQQLFEKFQGFNGSSIPIIANVTAVFEKYTKHIPPFDSKQNASRALKENLSDLVCGFLIHGITNETNVSVFPGIIHMTVMYGFEKIKQITNQFFDIALDEVFGGAIRTVDDVFSGLTKNVTHPFSKAILDQLNISIHGLLKKSFPSLNEAFDSCESLIKEHVTNLVMAYLNSLLETFIEYLLDIVDSIVDFTGILIDWLFEQLSLNKAEVMLTIWVVRD